MRTRASTARARKPASARSRPSWSRRGIIAACERAKRVAPQFMAVPWRSEVEAVIREMAVVPIRLRALELETAETLTFGEVVMLVAYVGALGADGNKTGGLIVQHVMAAGRPSREAILGAAEVIGRTICKRLGGPVEPVLNPFH